MTEPLTDTTIDDDTTSAAHTSITVYWRPGCPFCSMLRSGLRRAGLDFTEIDIWEDPEAAAFVRSVARGHETVPTVTVGTTTVVNPSARKVAELVRTGGSDTV